MRRPEIARAWRPGSSQARLWGPRARGFPAPAVGSHSDHRLMTTWQDAQRDLRRCWRLGSVSPQGWAGARRARRRAQLLQRECWPVWASSGGRRRRPHCHASNSNNALAPCERGRHSGSYSVHPGSPHCARKPLSQFAERASGARHQGLRARHGSPVSPQPPFRPHHPRPHPSAVLSDPTRTARHTEDAGSQRHSRRPFRPRHKRSAAVRPSSSHTAGQGERLRLFRKALAHTGAKDGTGRRAAGATHTHAHTHTHTRAALGTSTSSGAPRVLSHNLRHGPQQQHLCRARRARRRRRATGRGHTPLRLVVVKLPSRRCSSGFLGVVVACAGGASHQAVRLAAG